MIDWPSAAMGFSIPFIMGLMVVGAMRHDVERLRLRLNEIIQFARGQDREWTRRTMTGQDWNELVIIIQPYEEA